MRRLVGMIFKILNERNNSDLVQRRILYNRQLIHQTNILQMRMKIV